MEIIRNPILNISIDGDADVGICRRKSVSAAKNIGFDEVKSGEIAILVTELVTNVLRHGGGSGKIIACEIKKENKTGFEIWCADIGKGIPDFEKAITDGYSEKLSLGIGMGSIRRFSDELEINPSIEFLNNGSGFNGLENFTNCIRSLKWVPEKQWLGKNHNLIVGAISKSKPGEKLNGDAYVVNHISSNKTLVAVIDGLGHGKNAHLASQLAREQILKHPALTLDALLKHIHLSIRGTRGAVIALVTIDTKKNKLCFTGIGNIEGFLMSANKKKSLISYGGILGHNMRTPRIYEYDLNKNDILCLFSDGITTRWNISDLDWHKHPQQIAEQILINYSRQNDDATVLIIRNNL